MNNGRHRMLFFKLLFFFKSKYQFDESCFINIDHALLEITDSDISLSDKLVIMQLLNCCELLESSEDNQNFKYKPKFIFKTPSDISKFLNSYEGRHGLKVEDIEYSMCTIDNPLQHLKDVQIITLSSSQRVLFIDSQKNFKLDIDPGIIDSWFL